MIIKNRKETTVLYKNGREIAKRYKGTNLIYENFKQLISQGVPPLTLNKCKNTNMLGYKVYGESTQQTYTGKNLWNSELQQGCRLFSNGVYYSSYNYYLVNKDPIPVTAGETYTISAKNYTSYDAGFVFFNNGTFVQSLHQVSSFYTVTVPQGCNELYYNFRKTGSPNIQPGDIEEVQLEKGSSATAYEPYVGGVPAPNPDYPQEIQSVGEKTNNLWKGLFSQFDNQGGSGSIYGYFKLPKNDTIYTLAVRAKKDYTGASSRYLGFTATGGDATGGGVRWLLTNSTSVSKGDVIVTTTDSASRQYVSIYTNTQTTFDYLEEYFDIQLIEGNYTSQTLPSYEPYGYKIPIKVSGKNLITYPYSVSSQTLNGVTLTAQSDGSITLNGLCSASANFVLGTISVPQGKFTFSSNANKIPSSDGNACIQLYSYGTGQSFYIANNTATTPVTQTVTSGNFEFRVRIQTGVNYENVVYKPQLEKGDTATFYEPYYAPTTTNIYLNEPLRKIGNGTPQMLPDGYTQLEYIESTGTQYIDTQVAPNNTQFGVDIKFKFVNPSSAQAICGSANNGTPYLWNAIAYSSTYSDLYVQYSKNGSSTTARGIIGSGIDSASYNIKNTTVTGNINSNTFSDTCNSYSSNSHSIYLFARNDYGSASLKANARIYSCKITSNDTLVRNLIPAKNSSNVVGLYDLVNDVFYTNQGTGTFIAGNEIHFDYIDLETQKVYRNVYEEDNLINQSWTYATDPKSSISLESTYSASWRFGLRLKQNYGVANYILSNKFLALSPALIRGNGDYAIAFYGEVSGYRLVNYRIPFNNDLGITNLDTFKTWLVSADIKYLFVNSTPTEESITLPDILLNKGTNIVSVDTTTAPSNLWIKYKGKE